jgi:hypothetical protein
MSSTTSNEPSASYPPLPSEGTAGDLQSAQQNFEQRERATRSWRVFHRSETNNFKRRSLVDLIHSDSDSDSSSSRKSIDRKATSSSGQSGHHHSIRAVLNRANTAQTELSTNTGGIVIKDVEDDDPSRSEHLYRWVEIYENQRGCVIRMLNLAHLSQCPTESPFSQLHATPASRYYPKTLLPSRWRQSTRTTPMGTFLRRKRKVGQMSHWRISPYPMVIGVGQAKSG